MQLQISKIGGIKVIQAEDSKLDVTHKSEDGGKIGGFGHQGSNNTVDLGKGKRINTIKVYVDNNAQNEALHNILYLERYTTVTDKFRGTTNVYIDKFTMTDSDKHVGLTIYDITYTEQDGKSVFAQSFGISLFSDAVGLTNEILLDIKTIASILQIDISVPTIDTIVDNTNYIPLDFVLLAELEDGLIEIVRDVKGIDDYTFEAIEKQRLIEDVIGGVKNMTYSDNRICKAIENIIDFRTPERNIDADRYEKRIKQAGATITGIIRGRTEQKNTVTEHTREISNYPISEASRIFKPMVRGVEIENYDGINNDKYAISLEISKLLNKVKVARQLKSILLGGYNSREDFESEVDNAIDRLYYIGKREDETADIIYNTRAYANSQLYRHIFAIEIDEYKPLARIVYELYGDLDYYEAIRDINGFADNDRIIGKIKVYTKDVAQ